MADRERAALRLRKLAAQFVDDTGDSTQPDAGHFQHPRVRFEMAGGETGSIEQQLDMIENGDLKGDQILHTHGDALPNPDDAIEDVDQMMKNFRMNMAQSDREGDEMSGDEHSSGLQGDGASDGVPEGNRDGDSPGDELE